MKTYVKPMMEITSYEAENIMQLSNAGVQTFSAGTTRQYSSINFN